MSRRELELKYLFYTHIIPDLLAAHLHQQLVSPAPPTWNAFSTLSLVSVTCRDACEATTDKIFGRDNERKTDIIKAARALWNQTTQLDHVQVDHGPSDPGYTSNDLPNANLILVYIYATRAIVNAQSVNSTGTLIDTKETSPSGIVGALRGLEDVNARGCIFRALKLCEAILPERLAHLARNYLHSIYQAAEIHAPKLDASLDENDNKQFSFQSAEGWVQSPSTKSNDPLGADQAKIYSMIEATATFDSASLNLEPAETTVPPPQTVHPTPPVLSPDTTIISSRQRTSNFTDNTDDAQRISSLVYEATAASSPSSTQASNIDLESGRNSIRTYALVAKFVAAMAVNVMVGYLVNQIPPMH
ncbi:hypothetical protein K439DRAFT_1658568 [Ramaria rubella]|nr:hypothetical protein K439DRAFT_1658568 [Ramaria rubella]